MKENIIDALPYIIVYAVLLGYPIYNLYTAFFKKAPVKYVDELLEGKVWFKYRK